MARIIELKEMKLSLELIRGNYIDKYVSEVFNDMQRKSRSSLS